MLNVLPGFSIKFNINFRNKKTADSVDFEIYIFSIVVESFYYYLNLHSLINSNCFSHENTLKV